MTCTFFGHKDTPAYVKDKLREVTVFLIEVCDVDKFYVGTHGSFDRMAIGILREMKEIYPHIDYKIVLAYPPGKNAVYSGDETEYPEWIDLAPKKICDRLPQQVDDRTFRHCCRIRGT